MNNTTYHKVASHEAKEVKKCLLLYSGGLDTSVMLKWIYAADHATKLSTDEGIPFREAYQKVGNSDNYQKIAVSKDTIGSADNLCLDKIKNKWK